MELSKIKADITVRWDNWSVKYDDQYAHGLKSEKEAAAWKGMLADALGSSPLKVLDVGTGTGFLAILLAELGHSCLGIDLSPGMLDLARKKAQGKDLQVAVARKKYLEIQKHACISSACFCILKAQISLYVIAIVGLC